MRVRLRIYLVKIYFFVDRWQTSFKWDILDSEVQGLRTVLSNQDNVSIELSLLVEPFETVLRSRLGRLVLLLLGGYLFAMAITDLVLLDGYGVVNFVDFRFLPHESTNVALVGSFTLLFHGCPLRQYHLASPLSNSSAASGFVPHAFGVSFPSPVSVDGFVLGLTAAGAANGTGPGPFLLEGSIDGGETWAVIGARAFRQTRNGIRLLTTGGSSTRTDFDFRPAWPLVVDCCADALAGLAFVAAAAVAFLPGGPGDTRVRTAAMATAGALTALQAACTLLPSARTQQQPRRH